MASNQLIKLGTIDRELDTIESLVQDEAARGAVQEARKRIADLVDIVSHDAQQILVELKTKIVSAIAEGAINKTMAGAMSAQESHLHTEDSVLKQVREEWPNAYAGANANSNSGHLFFTLAPFLNEWMDLESAMRLLAKRVSITQAQFESSLGNLQTSLKNHTQSFRLEREMRAKAGDEKSCTHIRLVRLSK